MNRISVAVPTLVLSLTLVVCGAAEPSADQAKAIAEIEELHGFVTRDETNPDKPVIGLDLTGSDVTDAGLQHLRGLPQLQELVLHHTKVTDAGLGHLSQVTRLRGLWLGSTKVGDAGLKQSED